MFSFPWLDRSPPRAGFLLALLVFVLLVSAVPPSSARVILPERPKQTNSLRAYTPALAWRSLQHCKATYCPEEDIAGWHCGPACSDGGRFELYGLYSNASAGTFAYSGVHHDEQQIVIAFRGTTNAANWINNLDFVMMAYPDPSCVNCHVHRGFLRAYHSLRAAVRADASVLLSKYPSYTLLITGHSLGGALAVLCALDVSSLAGHGRMADLAQGRAPAVPRRLDLYTFGEPRVGNAALVAWAARELSAAKQFRLTHADDPVPHLPPRSWGYVHVPQELWFESADNASAYRDCEDSAAAEDPLCSDSVWGTSVTDHLFYLGTCTRCACSAAELEEIASYRLSPRMYALLAREHQKDLHQQREEQKKKNLKKK